MTTATGDTEKPAEVETEPTQPEAATAVAPALDHPVDRGWAWVVLACDFVLNALSIGFLRCFGVLFVAIQNTFEAKATAVSLIPGIQAVFFSLGAVVSMTFLIEFTSIQNVIRLGGVIWTLGMALCFLAQSVVFFYVSQGVLCGFGLAMVFGPGFAVLTAHFNKRRALAVATANTGGSVGTLLMPLVAQFLLDQYSLAGTYLLLGGVFAQSIVLAGLLTPLSGCRRRSGSDQESAGVALLSPTRRTSKDSSVDKDVPTVLEADKTAGHSCRDKHSNSPPSLIAVHNGATAEVSGCRTEARENQEEEDGHLEFSDEQLNRDSEIQEDDSRWCAVSGGHKSSLGHSPGKVGGEDYLEAGGIPDCRHILSERPSVDLHLHPPPHTPLPVPRSPADVSNVPLTHFSSSADASNVPLTHFSSSVDASNVPLAHFSSSADASNVPLAHFSSSVDVSNVPLAHFSSSADVSNVPLAHFSCETPQFPLENTNDQTNTQSPEEQKSRDRPTSDSNSTPHVKPKQRVSPCCDVSLLRSPLFWSLLLYMFFGVSGMNLTPVFLPPLAVEKGLSMSEAALLMTVVGALDIVSRLLPGLVTHMEWMRPQTMVCLAYLALGTSFQFTAFYNTTGAMMGLSVVVGLCSGVFVSTIQLITIDFVGMERFPKAFGMVQMAWGLGTAVGHPLLGYLRDVTGSFVIPFHVIGTNLYVSVVLLLLEPLLRRLDKKTSP